MYGFLSSLSVGVTLYVIILALWTTGLTLLGGDHQSLYHYLYNFAASILYFLGMITAFRSASWFRTTSTVGKMLLFTGLAFLLNGLANITWVYYNIVLAVELPYPSWADLFFILYYPALAMSFIQLLRMVKPAMTKRRILETIGLFLFSFVIVYLLIRPELPAGQITFVNILDLLYPLGDVTLMTLALLGFRLAGDKMRSILPYFILALLFDVVTDILFSYTSKSGYYFNGSIIDFMYVISAWLLIAGTIKLIHNLSAARG
ncbi:hypothetical protein A3A63_02235 [Candidatus Gottesmanbacteria bacterium RIFCSPLOWO2_01_FULL_46_9]|uniref:Histidine kinase N-terminal 7TM region domain-containing protein n=1 Tax=Candidatus Gottesmanbacteria bacterium RIFCSPLOWO2_01_FULL_46_9 TaxID=1798394 RepID=A0A1F6B357_9BACT|nr:MAG: hypothetical protein A3A63_02235 [Candidatus Gottesmanbacteria bacterium RIFCSPLOWO2_01_FULL_46_9]